ncbi:DUF4625 domain-containing protein [Algoriphagus sp. NG3]|uniref:DUF4625 domain-containing protein n=1 Tax=Algoriphagus sp. NG3 TaxID=3097546 RepID=UPI002A7F21EA|nr:DUF4625 domain-containing protein [Algoriphagus sp. NG3]WPR75926.1 DUF4625 domain-containing protein [Algoriphagus sp. NG3]
MMKNKINYLILLLSAGLIFSSCQDEDEKPVLAAPTMSNIELGLGNNEMAEIGKDFHFEADVVAGDKIEDIQINIRQKTGENYSGPWSFEVVWDEYKGLKNTNIHQHFDIPEDAVEGIYDFVITVNDQNGESVEVVRNLTIYSE